MWVFPKLYLFNITRFLIQLPLCLRVCSSHKDTANYNHLPLSSSLVNLQVITILTSVVSVIFILSNISIFSSQIVPEQPPNRIQRRSLRCRPVVIEWTQDAYYGEDQDGCSSVALCSRQGLSRVCPTSGRVVSRTEVSNMLPCISLWSLEYSTMSITYCL